MIKPIIELLRVAKKEGWQGEYIDVALGKNKLPETFKELLEKLNNGRRIYSKR